MPHFFKVTLRTHDVEAARRFYGSVLGEAAASSLDIVKLHEQAVARGARPHWLGFIEVDDVEPMTAAWVARGATSLGPKWVNPEGLEASVMRDPGGALVALGKLPQGIQASGEPSGVTWFHLNTPHAERALSGYEALFGWEPLPPTSLGPEDILRPFAWKRGGKAVGSMASIENRTDIHPHWLFHFAVSSWEEAVTAVHQGDGVVAATLTLPTGERIAVCDDAQGAAFVLRG